MLEKIRAKKDSYKMGINRRKLILETESVKAKKNVLYWKRNNWNKADWIRGKLLLQKKKS